MRRALVGARLVEQEASAKLGIGEQTVANYKFEFIEQLRSAVRSQKLPKEVFPELYES